MTVVLTPMLMLIIFVLTVAAILIMVTLLINLNQYHLRVFFNSLSEQHFLNLECKKFFFKRHFCIRDLILIELEHQVVLSDLHLLLVIKVKFNVEKTDSKAVVD